jgi:hypothetical protein
MTEATPPVPAPALPTVAGKASPAESHAPSAGATPSNAAMVTQRAVVRSLSVNF